MKSWTLAWLLLSLVAFVAAQGGLHDPKLPPAPHNNQTHICQPFGECEKCPDDMLDQPFCQPFGNRRRMHCVDADSSLPHAPGPNTNISPSGSTPAWESCGRLVSQERADFWEFVGCNLLFAGVSAAIVKIRQQRGEDRQARQLAARIGLVRGGRT